jgi:hypothetical protein
VTYQDRIAVTGSLLDLEIKTGVVISPVIYSKKEWENRPFKTPFLSIFKMKG